MEFGLNRSLDVLRVMLAANIPVKLESLPGAGKTTHIGSAVEASGGYIRTLVAVNMDPTDFGGIPVPRDTHYDLLPGFWAKELVDYATANPEKLTVLFLDEVNTAGRAVLASLLKVVDERRVGFLQLPTNVRIIMAMNPAEANGGVDLTPAMANRVAHLPFEYPLDSWTKGMREGFALPAPVVLPDVNELAELSKKYGSLIADFAESGAVRPGEFEQYPEDSALRSKPFPTRRSWTLAARAMAATELLSMDGTVQRLAVESLVGRHMGEELDDYIDTKSGMDPVAMLNDPDGFPLPEVDDALFTALDRMVNVALQSPTQAYIDAACKVLMRVGVNRPGVAASGMRNVAIFLRENRQFIGDVEQEAIRTFKPVIEAAGGME